MTCPIAARFQQGVARIAEMSAAQSKLVSSHLDTFNDYYDRVQHLPVEVQREHFAHHLEVIAEIDTGSEA